MPVARAEVVPHLPAHRVAAFVQCEGGIMLLLADGHTPAEYAEAMAELMQTEVDSRRWTQNWGGPAEPPQIRRAS